MRFRLLGAFEVLSDGKPITLGRRRERLFLALLALEAGRIVSVDRLIDLLWEGDEPARVLESVYSHVARLRAVLQALPGQPQILRVGTGYKLDVAPESVDVHRLRELNRRANRLPDPAQRSLLFSEAHSLWQGPPLADVATDRLRERIAPHLEELRLEALEGWLAAELELGNHRERLSDLAAAVAEFPGREKLIGLRMLALHRCGQSGEAGEAYGQYRHELVAKTGLEPGQELRELHAAILRGDSALDARPHAPPRRAQGAVALVNPFQLPAPIAGFAGREQYLLRIDEVATPEESGPCPIAAITGLGGAGKTTLAVHWAHRARDRYPDGQLYLNLRGFHPTESPVTVPEAYRRLLAAFSVPAQKLPSDVDAQAALFRSLIAGYRMLILLDNARDAEQVRPLLPGNADCFVLVTSRNNLAGLVVTEGAVPIPLEMFTLPEAHQLLALRLGAARVRAEPAAVAAIADRCAGLPLALSIVAARAAVRPAFALSAVLGELDQAHGRLDQLNAGDQATDVRSVFSWSYRTLSESGARLFRLLSLHPGPSVTCGPAAELLGVPEQRARLLLGELTQTHLISETSYERYETHDLVRRYAGELSESIDSSADRAGATRRIVGHYVRVGLVAAMLLDPERVPLTGMALHCPELNDQKEASAWFAVEQPILVRLIELSNRDGLDVFAWQLAWSITNHLQRSGQWGEWLNVLGVGLEAARRLADPEACECMHRLMGTAGVRTGRFDDAKLHLERAIELSRHWVTPRARASPSVGWPAGR